MLRNLLLLLIVPFILIVPQWSCCCISELVPVVKSSMEGESCCTSTSTPKPKESHQCKCEKISKTIEAEKDKILELSKKFNFDKEVVFLEEPSYLVGLKKIQNQKEVSNFIVTIRNDPPRTIYLQYCSLLI
jgi:hypothetical protein